MITNREKLNELSNRIIGVAIDVHKSMGSGFVEKIYQSALEYEFEKLEIQYDKEKTIKVKYKDVELGYQRVDFLVFDSLILELKCVSEINEIHVAQIISYLKTSDLRLGLIFNFSKPVLEIKGVVNNF